jgi:hypothetical protein
MKSKVFLQFILMGFCLFSCSSKKFYSYEYFNYMKQIEIKGDSFLETQVDGHTCTGNSYTGHVQQKGHIICLSYNQSVQDSIETKDTMSVVWEELYFVSGKELYSLNTYLKSSTPNALDSSFNVTYQGKTYYYFPQFADLKEGKIRYFKKRVRNFKRNSYISWETN